MTVPSCTLVGIGVGSGITAAHNASAEEPDDWHYAAPVVTGAAIGLVCDILLIMFLKKQWSQPFNQ